MRYLIYLISKSIQAIAIGIGFMGVIAAFKGYMKWEFVLLATAIVLFVIGKLGERVANL